MSWPRIWRTPECRVPNGWPSSPRCRRRDSSTTPSWRSCPMTSWPSRPAVSERFTLRSLDRPNGWSRSTPHLMQVGVDLSSSPRPVLSEEMQAGRAPAQQLLGQLGSDLDPDPPNLIIVVGHVLDLVGH